MECKVANYGAYYLGKQYYLRQPYHTATDNIGLPLQWEGNIIKKVRQIDVKLMLAGLKRVTGIIAMTKKLADELAPGRPYIIIPSIQNSYWTFRNISLTQPG